MKDSAPLWLQIVVAVVPLVAALVAGVFALTGTVSRRVERLKNIVEIQNGLPDWLDADHVVERIIVRELAKIDFATHPLIKGRNRSLAWLYALGTVGYALIILKAFSVIAGSWWFFVVEFALAGIMVLVLRSAVSAHKRRLEYLPVYSAMSARIRLRVTSSTPEHVADDSTETTTGDSEDETSPTGSHESVADDPKTEDGPDTIRPSDSVK